MSIRGRSVETTISLIAALAFTDAATAQDTRWKATPPSSDWNNPADWNPETVPTGTATFGPSTRTEIHFSERNTAVGTMRFEAEAPAYTFVLDGGQRLRLTASGIENLSANPATFLIGTRPTGERSSDPFNPIVQFEGSSTAGNSVFMIVDPRSHPVGGTGHLIFRDTSSAASATITNHYVFHLGGSSTASVSRITNLLDMWVEENATLDRATIANRNGGGIFFRGAGTADQASIRNSSAVVSFRDLSNAGSATILNETRPPRTGSRTSVGEMTSLGFVIGDTDRQTGYVVFSGNSRAGVATIVNNAGAGAERVETTGGMNLSNSVATIFDEDASAANAGITANGGTSGSFLRITGPRDAQLIETNNAAVTFFAGRSTAADATIVNNNAAYTVFFDQSSAGAATITSNEGAMVLFREQSSGGTARFVNNAGATFDISGLTAPGTQAGSIEGAGTVRLGSRRLTLGGNSRSTEISGVVSDGGFSGGTGGSLVKTGSGTLTLSAANSYTGGTAIEAGTLRIGNGGTGGSIVGDVANAGILAFDRSDAVTFGGIVSGSGRVRQAGTGTLTLTGANSYTGGTVVEAGTLQIGNGGTSGSIVGDVANQGTLVFNRSDSVTYGGAVSGAGALRQAGTGTLTLTGANTFTGGTTVAQGILLVNGSTAGATNVDAGARLGGTGRIGSGSFAGTVAPGSGGVGTLSTTGNVSFAAGSTFQVEVDEAGASDRLAAGGSATLHGGTVSAVFLGSPENRCGAPIRSAILTAQSGVAGTFSGATANFAFLTPSLSYDANNVFLTLTRNAATFAERGATANQRESAAAAEALRCGNALFDPLVQLSASNAQASFDQLSGEIHPSARGALLDDSRFLRDALAAARSDGRGIWASGYGSWGEIEADANAAALDRESTGLFGGVDLPLGAGWSAGLAGGRSRADFGVAARGSEADVRSWHAAARIMGRFGGFRFTAGGAMSWHDIETSRTVAFTGFSDTPAAAYDGRTRQIFAEAGYELPLGAATLEPFAAIARVDVETDAFAESGGAAALTGEEGSDDASFTTLGLRARAGMGPVSLTGSAAWRRSGVDASRSDLAFGSAAQSFVAVGAPIAEDALMLEAGAELAIGGAGRLRIVYAGQLAGKTDDHGGRATLSIPF